MSAEYLRFTPKESLFTVKPSVILLGVTSTTLDPESFTRQQWQEINAATTIASQAARTCYSPTIKTPLHQVNGSAAYKTKSLEIAADTKKAGHNTTREHVNYLFALSDVSRNFPHSILHAHPHGVSDMESQRYVIMSREGLMLPRNEQMITAGSKMIDAYKEITPHLLPIIEKEYYARFPKRKNAINEINKLATETARMILPIGFRTNLYHSVNALTLKRYYALSQTYDIGPEAAQVIGLMVDAVLAVDPSFADELDKPISIKTNIPPSNNYESANEFDLLLSNRPALLEVSNPQIISQLAQAIRLTIGKSKADLPDDEAVGLVLDPKQNPLLASTLGEITTHQLSESLNHVSLSSLVSISHAGDSQLQRHRGLTHTRLVQPQVPRLDHDIYIPPLIAASPQALEIFLTTLSDTIAVQESLANEAVPPSEIHYLDSNATIQRVMITGPLGPFFHFLKSRTCLTAQKEIYDIAVSITKQLPLSLKPYFDKPAHCGVRTRADITPYCSEGSHFCGLPIWQKNIADYPQRQI